MQGQVLHQGSSATFVELLCKNSFSKAFFELFAVETMCRFWNVQSFSVSWNFLVNTPCDDTHNNEINLKRWCKASFVKCKLLKFVITVRHYFTLWIFVYSWFWTETVYIWRHSKIKILFLLLKGAKSISHAPQNGDFIQMSKKILASFWRWSLQFSLWILHIKKCQISERLDKYRRKIFLISEMTHGEIWLIYPHFDSKGPALWPPFC